MSIKSGSMQYFCITNWEKYQHRDHKKTMPWIKTYLSQLDDEKTANLSCEDFGFWSRLLLLAGRMANRLPVDSRYLATRCNIDHAQTIPRKLALMRSLGLIQDMPARSGRADDALPPRLDKRRGEEMRKEGVESITPSSLFEEEIKQLKKAFERNKTKKIY